MKVGVISCNNLESFIYDEISQGIDISFESYYNDLLDQNLTDEQIEEQTDFYENDSSTILIGDWKKNNGRYEIDKNGTNGFSATYRENIICVEWSKTIKLCSHTSPCYVMANGTGLCGDLSTKGSLKSYSLPIDFFKNDND